MKLSLKSVPTSNLLLKVISLICGYTLWYGFGQLHNTYVYISVPVCFYGKTHHDINAPETISVTLSGKRSDLYRLNRSHLAVHINAETLEDGPNFIEVTPQRLFLPDSVKMVSYTPSNLIIECKQKII